MALGSLTSGVSALTSFAKGLEVIGNNVANVNTVGYKGATAQYGDSFSTLLKNSAPSTANGTGSNTPAMQVGTGVQLESIGTNFTQGTLTPTGSTTDLGISGNGFFRVHDAVSMSDFVTRAGNFTVDNVGNVVTQDGLRLQGLCDGSATYVATNVGGVLTYTKTDVAPSLVGDLNVEFSVGTVTNNTGGAFTDAQVAAGAPTMEGYSIDQFGNINVSLNNGDSVFRGKVLLQNFSDPSALERKGGNLYSNLSGAGPQGGLALNATNNAAGTNGLGTIQSKSLELSNVDLSSEFANMITTQRAFQAGSRIVTVSDGILEEVVNLKRS